jgi:N-acetylglucosamine kinase-like BadF-type ATPase
MRYFLGADIGGTKTHTVIADENGQIVGFGKSGPGNPQGIGYKKMLDVLKDCTDQALTQSGLSITDIHGAGFGIAGYDWPSDRDPMAATIKQLNLTCPFHMVNDTIPGLVAGTREGWGISIVAGTGCNCRGWDRQHQHEGRVTGYGQWVGENAGSGELILRAMQIVNYAWIKRNPPTALSNAFIEYAGAKNLDDLMEGYTVGKYSIGPEAASVVFQVAESGDEQAIELIRWAGQELGEMVNAVARQLEFEKLDFEVVMVGGMFAGGEMLIEAMREKIHSLAPRAQLVRLSVPPVIGSVLIGMEQGGLALNAEIRQRLCDSIPAVA